MKRSLGDKRRYLTTPRSTNHPRTRHHGTGPTSRLFDNADFGYRRITVLRPLRLCFQITVDARSGLKYRPGAVRRLLAVQGRTWQRTAAGLEPKPGRPFSRSSGPCPTMSKLGQGRQRHGAEEDLPRLLHRGGSRGRARHRQTPQSSRSMRKPCSASPCPLDDEAFTPCWACKRRTRAGRGERHRIRTRPGPGRDAENIPLPGRYRQLFPAKEFSLMCQMPGSTARRWTSRTVVSAGGLRINFNGCSSTPAARGRWPRSILELAEVEKRILELLREVTE